MYKASGSKARRPIGALVVNTDSVDNELPPGEEQDHFQDVEAFLADHGEKVEQDVISESEAAEALAVAWKDRRHEIQKHESASSQVWVTTIDQPNKPKLSHRSGGAQTSDAVSKMW